MFGVTLASIYSYFSSKNSELVAPVVVSHECNNETIVLSNNKLNDKQLCSNLLNSVKSGDGNTYATLLTDVLATQCRDVDGKNILHVGIQYGQYGLIKSSLPGEIIVYLISQKDNEDKTPIEHCQQQDRPEILIDLAEIAITSRDQIYGYSFQRYLNITCLYPQNYEGLRGNFNGIFSIGSYDKNPYYDNDFLQNVFDPRSLYSDGHDTLYYAIKFQNEKFVATLTTDFSFDINSLNSALELLSKSSYNPQIFKMVYNQVCSNNDILDQNAILKRLISEGDDQNLQVFLKNGNIPHETLQMALRFASAKPTKKAEMIIDLLIHSGADPNERDANGILPIKYAKLSGINIEKLLEKQSFDTSYKEWFSEKFSQAKDLYGFVYERIVPLLKENICDSDTGKLIIVATSFQAPLFGLQKVAFSMLKKAHYFANEKHPFIHAYLDGLVKIIIVKPLGDVAYKLLNYICFPELESTAKDINSIEKVQEFILFHKKDQKYYLAAENCNNGDVNIRCFTNEKMDEWCLCGRNFQPSFDIT